MKKETIGLILKSAAVSALRKCLGRVHQLLQEQPKMIARKPKRRPFRLAAFRPALFLFIFVALCYTNVMAVRMTQTVKVNPKSKAVEPFWMWPNDDLRLIIQPKDPIRYDIAWSRIVIQSAGDSVLWRKTSHSSQEDIYDVANAFPGTEFMSVIGELKPRGDGPGRMPIFQVTVPEVDIDWDKPGYREDSAERGEDEDTRILSIGPDVIEPFIVRRPIERADGMVPAKGAKRPMPDLELRLSGTNPGLLVYTTQADALAGVNPISFPRLIPRETWTSTSASVVRFFAKQDPTQQILPPGEQEIRLKRIDRYGNNPTGFEGDVSGVTSDSIKFRHFRVDINKILSDQFSGAGQNRLPPIGANPGQNRPMLMGCAVGNTAKVKVEATVQPFSLASITYLGARRQGTTTILNSVLINSGGQTSLSWENTEGDAVFEIVGGTDQNSDGDLDPAEVCMIYEDGVRVINQSQYNNSKTGLQILAVGGGLLASYPTASDLLFWFLNNTVSDSAVSLSDKRLTHPVGVSWSGSTGQCSKYNFSNCPRVVWSTAFTDAIMADASASHYSEISTYFASNPGDTHVFGPWACTFTDFNFPNTGNAYDKDLYYAFHGVGTVTVTSYRLKVKDVSGDYQVFGHEAEGCFYDLYDFAYGATMSFATSGARVQAGHPSLGTSGRVFQIDRVNFNGSSGM